MTSPKVSAEGINELIVRIRAGGKDAEDLFARQVGSLLDDGVVAKSISRAAGARHKKMLSLGVKDLLEDVRQDAVILALRKAQSDWKLKSDAQSAEFIRKFIVWSAAGQMVNRHLGTLRKDGSRTKDLSETPFKWGSEEEESARNNAYLREAEFLATNSNTPDSDLETEAQSEKLASYEGDLALIFTALQDGYEKQEIADALGITVRTLENRVKKIAEVLSGEA